MAVRLKDIAQDLGVSTITVSKVLRGGTDISEATRERVLRRVQELNYRPNMLARGLAGGPTGTMGLLVPDLVQPFFAEFAKALSSLLREHDLALILASSEEDPAIEEREIRALVHRGVDVLLLASCRESLLDLPALGVAPTPCVLFDRSFRGVDAAFVGLDEVEVGRLATNHLLEQGCTRVAHIGGKATSPAVGRLEGYCQAVRQHGLVLPAAYVHSCGHVEEGGFDTGFEAMQALLALPVPPDAVFCYNDMTAVGAMEAVLRAGLRVPEDVAVVGCGNFRFAEYLRRPLSSIDQNVAELGRIAGTMALALAVDAQAPARQVLLQPRLIARASSLRRERG
ncbi:LacI family DNA-binding transcriptional regulator [Acidipila sp. EB88]|uniref:LacI family DNA-binding transcriptional regulator n=1 Tax=Acidipila sp. EB88 TaxID=2305226 RepID=UPI000F5F90CB|nr:LacI family DNA-binding transcriptional regulator [Acidipila sp. EB88]RRA49805.1 LacI family transcriptional regulator [Acidipila sp. EB88]